MQSYYIRANITSDSKLIYQIHPICFWGKTNQCYVGKELTWKQKKFCGVTARIILCEMPQQKFHVIDRFARRLNKPFTVGVKRVLLYKSPHMRMASAWVG